MSFFQTYHILTNIDVRKERGAKRQKGKKEALFIVATSEDSRKCIQYPTPPVSCNYKCHPYDSVTSLMDGLPLIREEYCCLFHVIIKLHISITENHNVLNVFLVPSRKQVWVCFSRELKK